MGTRLENRVALVTGSTSGIGRASAKLFAAEGAKVVVNGRRKGLGQSLVEEIRAVGGEASYYPGDLGNSQTVRDLVRFAISTYGRLDVLMNNAFSDAPATAVELAESDWDRALAVMLKAPYLACQEAIPQMIRQGGGSIINTSSVHALMSRHRRFVYAVAKAGLIAMVRQLTVDFGPYGIRANALIPGKVLIERIQADFAANPDLEPQAKIVYPLRRIARPLDLAYGALYLACDESSMVSGTTLTIDGGMMTQLHDSLYAGFEEYYRGVFSKGDPEARGDR